MPRMPSRTTTGMDISKPVGHWEAGKWVESGQPNFGCDCNRLSGELSDLELSIKEEQTAIDTYRQRGAKLNKFGHMAETYALIQRDEAEHIGQFQKERLNHEKNMRACACPVPARKR